MTYNELTQHVECTKCDNWEQQGAHESRHHIAGFTLKDGDKNIFICNDCNSKATSEYIVNTESNDYEPITVIYKRDNNIVQMPDYNVINPATGQYKKWIKAYGVRYNLHSENIPPVLF